MDEIKGEPVSWTLDGKLAQLRNCVFAGKVNVGLPNLGLHCDVLSNGSAVCRLLGTVADHYPGTSAWPIEIADSYVRGNDLVTSYRAIDDWPYSPQIYWSANTLTSVNDTLGSLSLLVSVQTHLLDTHPQIHVHSCLPNSETQLITLAENGAANVESVTAHKAIARDVEPSGATFCLLWRPVAAPISYVEIASAIDIRRITIGLARSENMLATWQLFAEFLEKGVILRSRVHGAILPRANDTELALECCRAAQQAPLPLTS